MAQKTFTLQLKKPKRNRNVSKIRTFQATNITVFTYFSYSCFGKLNISLFISIIYYLFIFWLSINYKLVKEFFNPYSFPNFYKEFSIEGLFFWFY